MITPEDYPARGWNVIPSFAGQGHLNINILEKMTSHPEAPGESCWGTRNMLHSMILSLKPKTVLEIGSHIGFGSVVIGTALKANNFGHSYHLEPQDHYFKHLSDHLVQAGVSDWSTPLKMMSTDPGLSAAVGGSADLIFLDANHSYTHALNDIRISDRLLPKNGMILLDDVGSPHSENICQEGRGGVRHALLDFCRERSDYSVIFFEPPFWLNPCGLALLSKK